MEEEMEEEMEEMEEEMNGAGRREGSGGPQTTIQIICSVVMESKMKQQSALMCRPSAAFMSVGVSVGVSVRLSVCCTTVRVLSDCPCTI